MKQNVIRRVRHYKASQHCSEDWVIEKDGEALLYMRNSFWAKMICKQLNRKGGR